MSRLRTAVAERGRALTVIGGGAWRADVLADARSTAHPDARIVEISAPAARLDPWAGVGAFVEALSTDLAALAPMHAASLEAASTGRVVGDHLGIGVDLRGLLAASSLEGPTVVLVPEAHLLDLASAAALSFACRDLAGLDLAVVVSQEPSTRGVIGLDVVHQELLDLDASSEPDDRTSTDPSWLLRHASPLDAADAYEEIGAWADAARLWLLGGRPDRARRALARAAEDPLALETGARLAFTTESMRIGAQEMTRAAERLAADAPTVAGRLRVLLVAGLLNRGELDRAEELVTVARRGLDGATACAEVSAALDLVEVAGEMVAVTRGSGIDGLLQAYERPLARLAEGGVDRDVVAVLTSLTMPLTWRGQFHQARELLDRVIGLLDARRALAPLALPLATSAWLARRQGLLDRALADGTLAIEIARATGAVNDARFALAEVAHVEAMQGRLEACRRHVGELVPTGTHARGPAQLGAISALAVAELLAGNPERAVDLLEPVQASFGGSVSPAQVAWRYNLIEAYVLCGRRDDALRVLHNLEQWVDPQSPDRVRGQLERSRAVLAAANYERHFHHAMELLVDAPALRWRTGQQYLRRLLADGRRAEAEPLAFRLLAEAGAVGAGGGVEQMRRQLTDHGIAPPPSAPTAAVLSVEHLRIALLLAEGADDGEIAAQLRISRPTVSIARRRILDLLQLDDVHALRHRLGHGVATDPDPVTEVALFGPVAVTRNGSRITPPPGQPATLLALVALRTAVHVEEAIDTLWTESSVDEARPRLRNVLARLRSAVGPVVVRDGEQLRLARGIRVDVHRFRALAEGALTDGPRSNGTTARPGSSAPVEAALDAWGGRPLEGWPYEDWALRESEQLWALHERLTTRTRHVRS